ncbi:unnamed protein product [Peronospora farinosa]|uniref:Uncharacterized protein n=1 Tax=Peronospora farinosa TaxID=134698 RepID=A0AAV0T666_9STRA|nr:unnamed protein product [Peronospora farinosa]
MAMGESKQQEAKGMLRSRQAVSITAVKVSPNPAALAAELNLEVNFHLEAPIANGVWNIEYLVDSVMKLKATDYARGDNRFQFSTPQVNISGLQPSQLTNCGLLIASFKDEDGDILDLNMVIQVSEQRGGLQRIIYSPLE